MAEKQYSIVGVHENNLSLRCREISRIFSRSIKSVERMITVSSDRQTVSFSANKRICKRFVEDFFFFFLLSPQFSLWRRPS